jgi:uncharacterized OB-fold protein
MSANRPLPAPDEFTAPLWGAAREHRLEIQRCTDCRRWQHVPALMCPSCGSSELRFEPVSGRASLYSWTVIHDPPAPGFADLLPLIVGLVELEEQERLLLASNIIGVSCDSLRLGLPLEVAFEDLAGEATLPQFMPATR